MRRPAPVVGRRHGLHHGAGAGACPTPWWATTASPLSSSPARGASGSPARTGARAWSRQARAPRSCRAGP